MLCPCCGSTETREQPLLWRELIDEWRLASHEVDYINRQQGLCCTTCGSNLRSMALAKAITACFRYSGSLEEFVGTEAAGGLPVLEINEAGTLSQFLGRLPNHEATQFPEVDMSDLPFEDLRFELVVHSDTLEHVRNPIRGLSECRRVLRPGGFCAFTVPMIVDRLTMSRDGLAASYHGSPENPQDHLVHTEYGADAWKHVILAGFSECRVVALEYPAAQALVGVK